MGILNDIAKRDLSGGKKIENLLRPSTKLELKDIVKNEINKQGNVVDLRHIAIPENISNLSYLFEDYYKIESLDLTGWNVSNIESFDEMFSGCGKLKIIRGIENWNVSKGYDFIMMFNDCKSLEKIDLSGWRIDFNPQKVNNSVKYNNIQMNNMFAGCKNLKKIVGFENWNIPKYFSDTITKGFCMYITRNGNIIR